MGFKVLMHGIKHQPVTGMRVKPLPFHPADKRRIMPVKENRLVSG